jgi:hypothetical protein
MGLQGCCTGGCWVHIISQKSCNILHWQLWQQERPLLGLVSFQVSCSSRFCFVLTDDGFRSKVSGFVLLGLLIVRFAFTSVVFCSNFSPLLFLLLFPCQVFFVYLFIYLFLKL